MSRENQSNIIPNRMAAVAPNPYITGPTRCPLTAKAKTNISRVHILVIDSYPNLSHKFYKYVKPDVQIPEGSGIEPRPCNPHADYIAATMLGVNAYNVPIYQNMKITFLPCISCFGTAWDPYIVKSLEAAQVIAKQNATEGINTVISYSIGGSYNSKAKVDAMRTLASLPRTYFLMSSGNDGQRNYCVLPTLSLPDVFVVGATKNGKELSEYGNIGPCVKFYTPGRYKTPVNGKIIWGTSYAQPIASNIFINMLLNHPDATREQIYGKVAALTNSVPAKTLAGNFININIFPKAKVCTTNPVVATTTTAKARATPMVTQFSMQRTPDTKVPEDLLHDPIAVPENGLPISAPRL